MGIVGHLNGGRGAIQDNLAQRCSDAKTEKPRKLSYGDAVCGDELRVQALRDVLRALKFRTLDQPHQGERRVRGFQDHHLISRRHGGVQARAGPQLIAGQGDHAKGGHDSEEIQHWLRCGMMSLFSSGGVPAPASRIWRERAAP